MLRSTHFAHVDMNFRTKLRIAAGKRSASRGGLHPPPIGTWERLGWDEWHNELDWDRRQREARENKNYIMTGHFRPIRSRAPLTSWPRRIARSPVLRVFAALGLCGSIVLAGRYALHLI